MSTNFTTPPWYLWFLLICVPKTARPDPVGPGHVLRGIALFQPSDIHASHPSGSAPPARSRLRSLRGQLRAWQAGYGASVRLVASICPTWRSGGGGGGDERQTKARRALRGNEQRPDFGPARRVRSERRAQPAA
ncbi:MAG: hypothetical protein ACREYE_03870, partial [Gammaproteobacteria bacterium]